MMIVRVKRLLLGCAVLAFFLGIATVVSIGYNSAAKVIVQPAQSQSQPTAAEARNTYLTGLKAESARNLAVTATIEKKYAEKIDALEAQELKYSKAGVKFEKQDYDCTAELLELSDSEKIELAQEDIKHQQTNEKIFDKYQDATAPEH
jgi:hypothetical protein